MTIEILLGIAAAVAIIVLFVVEWLAMGREIRHRAVFGQRTRLEEKLFDQSVLRDRVGWRLLGIRDRFRKETGLWPTTAWLGYATARQFYFEEAVDYQWKEGRWARYPESVEGMRWRGLLIHVLRDQAHGIWVGVDIQDGPVTNSREEPSCVSSGGSPPSLPETRDR